MKIPMGRLHGQHPSPVGLHVGHSASGHPAGLEPGRREVFERLRAAIADHLPPGFEERMSWGMPTWAVPLSRFPAAYASAVGRKPDMGKSCLRFADPARIPYGLIGELASWITVEECIALFADAQKAGPAAAG